MSEISKNPVVARYSTSRHLIAIHLGIDDDYAERLDAAKENQVPPEGGFYLMFPSAEDATSVAPATDQPRTP